MVNQLKEYARKGLKQAVKNSVRFHEVISFSDSDQPILQGAVSTGHIRKFGHLNREPVLRILVDSLEP